MSLRRSAKSPAADDGGANPQEALSPREQTARDLMRFFRERKVSVSDAIQYSAFFVGFAAASLMSANGVKDAEPDGQQMLASVRKAIDDGLTAVRRAVDSDVGRTLKAHKYI